MPVNPTYPGVYIEELPSGVHPITGVATSIAAFVGWAPKGPTDSAQLVLSWADYVREYGGLDSRSELGYSVWHFFSNGGQQAYIIRLVDKATAKAANTSPAVNNGTLTISAKNPGLWANSYGIAIKNQLDESKKKTGRFRLQVIYSPKVNAPPTPLVVESFENLSMAAPNDTTPDPQGRFIADIVNAGSRIVTVKVTESTTGTPPDPPADISTDKPQMLGAGTGSTKGEDGTVLRPSTDVSTPGDFEKALTPTSGAEGVYLLDHVDLFNLLCIPGEIVTSTLSTLEKYCEGALAGHPLLRAFLIADPDPGITDYTKLNGGPPISAKNAAFYFPWINAPDPLRSGVTRSCPPCGFVAGIYASTDGSRGVWKAPAGTEAGLTGVMGPAIPLNDAENGVLNPVAVNCIRNFPVYGNVIWGSRTTQGNDEIGSQWKYIPVRRTALYIEESLYRGTKWAVFEPNDEPLWSQLRLNIGAFMHELFRKGAFQGQTPKDAYFVKCDKETTTQNDINLGIVNVVVGFAPLKPAEFVVIQIQQMAGQIAT